MRKAEWVRTLRTIWIYLRNLFSQIPIFGGLVFCSAKNHVAAIKEFIVIIGFGTATFWLSALIASFLAANANKPLIDLAKGNISDGQLFIFAVSLLGPIFYTALDDPIWAKRAFPEKAIHIALTALLATTAAAAFAFIKTGVPTNQAWIFTVSLWITGISLVLRYLTMVYSKMRAVAPHDIQADQESAFVNRAKEHALARQQEGE